MQIGVEFKQTDWNEATKKAIEIGLTKASILMRNDATKECPVLTGRLVNSITREVKENEARVFTGVEYAAAVEFGVRSAKSSKRKKGHAYMRPALYNNQKKIEDIINNEIKKASVKSIK
jgi:phage gpG-like protein